jgi:pimeloyl-ACP methyl ester carboxylesterase
VSRPGLLIFGEKDQYMPPEFARKMSARTGAELVLLPGGHWWPAQFPQEVAAALESFWVKQA